MEWTTACPDWEQRIINGDSLIPFDPLFPSYAQKAMDVFCSLRIIDLQGRPTFGEISRPWVFDLVNAIFGSYDEENGEQLIKEVFLFVSKKNSKALALDTPIPTPCGWKTIKDVRIGDIVFGADGKQYNVIGESEIFYNHDCYSVEFSNGEKVIADAGHLWRTSALIDRPGAGRGTDNSVQTRNRVRTTEEIFNTLHRPGDGSNNHSIVMPDPIQCDNADLPISPYTLGAWLGDGHSASARITSADEEVMTFIKDDGYTLGTRSQKKGARAWAQCIGIADRTLCIRGHDPSETILIKDKKRNSMVRKCLACEREMSRFRRSNGPAPSKIIRKSLNEILRDNHLLNNKHIPEIYFRASYEQRLALLQGLMDTDGTINKNGRVLGYVGINKKLVYGVYELLATFGIKSSIKKRPVTCNGVGSGFAYFVQFMAFRDRVPVFRLNRKLDRMRYSDETKRKNRSQTVHIKNVVKTQSVPVKCISVDSEDHQFLFGKTMLPTHNSTLAAAIMMTALILNWRESAELIILAPTVKVAGNSFDPAKNMCRQDVDEELFNLMKTQEHYKKITNLSTGAILNVVAADSQTVSGIKGSAHFIDELHEFGKKQSADSMINEATGGMASRNEGFIVWASTQSSEAPAGIFKTKLEYARNVRDGKIHDPQFLPIIYEFPDAYIKEEKYLNPKHFYITNPNLGASVSESFLVRKYNQSQNDGKNELSDFLAKNLNVQMSMSLKHQRWAGADFWESAAGKITLDTILEESEVVVIGIDGGGLDDLLGLAVMGRHRVTRDWLLWNRAWCHPIALERRKTEAPKYRDFEKTGDLIIVDDIGQDVRQIGDIVIRCDESGLLDRVGVDPAGIGDIVDELEGRDIDHDRIIGIPQGWRLNGAIKTTERKIAERTLTHGGQSLMSWCVSNARAEIKGNNIYITKQASGTGKIDPLMATFNATALMAMNPSARITKSIYSGMTKEQMKEAML